MEIVLKTIDWEQLSDKIISCSEKIRFVGIMDLDGNVINKRKSSTIKADLIKEIEMFEADQLIIKNIQSVFDDYLGVVYNMEMYRKFVSQIIHYYDNHIIYITTTSESEESFHNLSPQIRLLLIHRILVIGCLGFPLLLVQMHHR